MDEFRKTILVRKDKFEPSNFQEISPAAEAEIARAKSQDLLAIAITMNSPLRVVDAKIYTREVFDAILRG